MRKSFKQGDASRQLLLVAGDASWGKSLGFVLELAGYRVTVVQTLFEAADWVVKRLNTAESFSALVIGPGHSWTDTVWLSGLLGAAGAAMPIICTTPELPRTAEHAGVSVAGSPEEIVAILERLSGKAGR